MHLGLVAGTKSFFLRSMEIQIIKLIRSSVVTFGPSPFLTKKISVIVIFQIERKANRTVALFIHVGKRPGMLQRSMQTAHKDPYHWIDPSPGKENLKTQTPKYQTASPCVVLHIDSL